MNTHAESIYVEAMIRCSVDEIWRFTQTPELHERWDLRFTNITYHPRADETQPQRFLYSTRIGFGLKIDGEGETVGDVTGADGQRTSALKFGSKDPKSLIREGSGYWKYTPTGGGVRFETGYDYRVRFGSFGRFFDKLFFRPLIGWATAWSFDRLRLWIERGIDPALSLERSITHALARLTIAFIWLYHGIVPKLIFQNPDELTMLRDAGAPPGWLDIIGGIEVGIGLLMLVSWTARWPFLVTIALMVLSTIAVTLNSPAYLVAAFNPVTLNVAMTVLALTGLVSIANLPSASRCRRKKQGDYA